jgi:AraC-like DNA-binding protein
MEETYQLGEAPVMTGRKPKLTLDQVHQAQLRKFFGWKIDDIARKAGVSPTTLKRYLRGECRHHENRHDGNGSRGLDDPAGKV